MGTLTLLVLAAVGTWRMAEGVNLLRNPGFEEPVVGADWKGYGFGMTRTRDDARNGTFSLPVSYTHLTLPTKIGV